MFIFEKKKCRFLYLFFLCFIILFSIDDKVNGVSRAKGLSSSRKFIQKCLNEELIFNISNKFFLNPKISAIIPLYDCEKTIKATVRSIQNQNLTDIEIILVNDNSKDNTSKIIRQLAKEDNRIKIINNVKNMATLYSRNIGILNSKGKYIMNIDNDDLFMDFDVFDYVYKEAEKGNFDIIGFGAIDSTSYNPKLTQMKDALYHDHKDGLILYQPELTYFAITTPKNKFGENDLHVWGRLTKSNVYKMAINNFGKNAIGEIRNLCFVTWAEDSSISMAILRSAKSYKFIKKYGIFHYIGKTTTTNKVKNDIKIYGNLFFLDAIFDFSHENYKGKKYSVEMIKKRIFINLNAISDDRNCRYLKAILNKMLSCEYISLEDKKVIKKNLDILNLKKK